MRIPTVGSAKSWSWGEYDEPGIENGDRSPLIDRGETIGAVPRSRSRVKPLFVSSGHLCDVESAVCVVLGNLGKYRLPLAARPAHGEVNGLRELARSGEVPSS